MDITISYFANGGDTTPVSETKTVTPPETYATFVLASPITKEYPTNKYLFKGWKIGDAVYGAGDTVRLVESSVAVAVFEINKTGVSPKDYGRSPIGIRNALGSTRFRHQPSFPHAMGVGAKRVVPPESPTPPTIKELEVDVCYYAGTNAGSIIGKNLNEVSHEGDDRNNKVVYWRYSDTGGAYTKANGHSVDSTHIRCFEVYWTIGRNVDIKFTSEAEPLDPDVPRSKEYQFSGVSVIPFPIP